MSKTINNKDQKGFTIIEVLIVLAIAALILLVVFLAVPELQRSQRNSGRKSDIGKLIVSVNNFVANTNGTIPNISIPATASNDCMSIYNDSNGLSQFKGWTTCTAITGYAGVSENVANSTIVNSLSKLNIYIPNTTSPGPATSIYPASLSPTANAVIIFPSYRCTNQGVYTSLLNPIVDQAITNPTTVSIVYASENGSNSYIWNCINSR